MFKEVHVEFKPGTLLLQGTWSYHYTSEEVAVKDMVLILL